MDEVVISFPEEFGDLIFTSDESVVSLDAFYFEYTYGKQFGINCFLISNGHMIHQFNTISIPFNILMRFTTWRQIEIFVLP